MIELKIKKLSKKAKIPVFGGNNYRNAALDIYADENTIIWPKCKRVISTNIAIEMIYNPALSSKTPEWFKFYLNHNFKLAAIIKSRSGLSAKYSLEHGAGLIDEGYNGEIKIILHNHGWFPKRIKKHERIAQLMPILIPFCKEFEVSELSKTERGTNGFGSTGVK